MKNLNKKIILLIIIVFSGNLLSAYEKQQSQLIQSGHWLYDDLETLSAETKTTMILATQPMSVGEIEFFLKEINYDILSDAGKVVYERVLNYLNDKQDFVEAEEFRFYINLKLTPEFYYRSNKNIKWSFDPYYIKDNAVTMPVIIGFSDYFTFQSDFFYGMQPAVVNYPDNFTNIPFDPGLSNFYYPEFSYFSSNFLFNKWGVSAHIGKKGLQLGNSNMDSIIYSKRFDTDFYTQLNLYNKYMKYSMSVSQILTDKYVYLHQLTFRPHKIVNFAIIEGSLINAPFELRFLNPFNIMHEFGAWHDYDPNDEQIYGESHFCAYFALTFEIVPIKNMRIYGLYAQNEMIDPGSGLSEESRSVPCGMGGQVGIEYNIPLKNNAHLKTNIETIYTSPFLYLKGSPDWSLYTEKNDEYGNPKFCSWMGSPAGPDSFIVQASAMYDSNKKWNITSKYKFMIHGDNTSENLFSSKNKYPSSKNFEYWAYYPYIRYRNTTDENVRKEAVAEATNLWMSGIAEYLHQFTINGNYKILNNLELSAQIVYSFIFNSRNIQNNLQHGLELSIAASYEIF